MEVLTPRGDLERFFGMLRKAPRPILFTDYDGTLAPFRKDPSKATPYVGVRELLDEIRSQGTRLIVVSGRAIDDLLPLLALDGVEIWGSHGRERQMAGGRRSIAPIPRESKAAMSRAEQMLRAKGLEQRCEKKPGCIAVHHRGLDPSTAERIEQEVAEIWSQVTTQGELELKHFDGGVELQVPGISKGTVIRRVLQEVDEVGPSVAYLGDDLTDENAFEELREKGLCVLVRSEFRTTGADLWLTPPDELLSFLERWSEMTKDRP
jgi:trehalose 6-phosphate phosphatase